MAEIKLSTSRLNPPKLIAFGNKLTSLSGLLGIIVDEQAGEDVGVKADHRFRRPTARE